MERKGLAAFEKALGGSEELRGKYEEAMRRLVESGEALDDADALQAVAAELGFELSAEEVERARAEAQDLDLDEMELVAGGGDQPSGEDEKGHDSWCWTAWHCYAATVHTDSKSGRVACWANYLCVMAMEHNGRDKR